MEYGLAVLEMILVNIVLSGDNAMVIAMASKNLPPPQRRKAVWWGAAGAVILRIGLTAGAAFLLNIPYVQGIGALLLMYIAIKLLADDHERDAAREARSMFSAVWTIIAADLIMSLDNVLAIAALSRGNLPLLIFGIAMSLPLIVGGSHLIVRLLGRYPVLVVAGSAILAYTAGEMFTGEAKIREWFAGVHASFDWAVPLFFTLFILFFGYWTRKGCRS